MFARKTIFTIGLYAFNLALLAALLWYFLKTYIIPWVREQLAQSEMALQDKEERISDLKVRHRILDEQIYEQSVLCEKLKQRLSTWQNVIADKRESKQEEAKQWLAQRQERRALQAKNLEKELIRKKLLPQAVEQARSELQKKFTDDKSGAKYVDTVLMSLKKGYE